ncbi:MAG: glycoside hydrolase family 71/99-like protein [Isosphaeraceae bacterium]|nr:glycoside hydrolase family 71/99-like protein [Isosphaeraceae bacterium]
MKKSLGSHTGVVLVLLTCSVMSSRAADGIPLAPTTGADGAFETLRDQGAAAWHSLKDDRGAYWPFLYFRVPDAATRSRGPVYVEIRYKDTGPGRLALQYNGQHAGDNYRQAERGFGRLMAGTGAVRTVVFELAEPGFRHAQNLGADLRLAGPGGDTPLHVFSAALHEQPPAFFREHAAQPWLQAYKGPSRGDVDASALRGKVICGYQGWFRCPGDDTEQGWVHWSRDSSRITPKTLTVEMWPDMTEYTQGEKFPAAEFRSADGRPAYLFSSAHPRTVERHFEWMRDYGIDGVLVQRFTNGLRDPAEASRVLGYARDAANRTGRIFAVEYDLSGMRAEGMPERVAADWKWLVDEMKITADPRYLRQDGKPVLAIFGFYSDRFAAGVAHRMIDFFKDDPKYRVFLIGGVPWAWRTEKDVEWARAYRRLDAIKPWNVGNTAKQGGVVRAATRTWADDQAEARRAGMLWMPVLYPGFSWDNLQRRPPGTTIIPRRRGAFFREQFEAAARLGAETAFVAMFDEVDEGTAVFKVTSTPPQPGHIVTLEGLPSDTYLKLTGEGTKLIRGR